MHSILSARAAGACLLSAACLYLAGCGGGNPTGTVSGKVTYKGAPVTSGSVNFMHTSKGIGAEGKLDGSGNFTLEGSLEVGSYKVYIQPPLPEQLPPGKVATTKAQKFDLPPKYQDLAQTPETREVQAGPNSFTIDLK